MRSLLIALSLLSVAFLKAQDTFSIVAVDSATGEVGSAGATCLEAPNPPEGALIISGIVPGRGAIHTQASWDPQNQQYAYDMMEAGYSPQMIIDELVNFDATGNPTIRQYGVADFDSSGRPRAAAYTGSNCYDYKNHILGSYYAIQGNILLNQGILDSMESRFLNTAGSLADRLMAALQGANVPGADTRCMVEGVPSQSAFVRVARPVDTDSVLYLHLVVKSRPYGMSPIDSLQTLFNEWKSNLPSAIAELREEEIKIYPNPATEVCSLRFMNRKSRTVEIFSAIGKMVYQTETSVSCELSTVNWTKGIYFIRSGNQVQKLVVQ